MRVYKLLIFNPIFINKFTMTFIFVFCLIGLNIRNIICNDKKEGFCEKELIIFANIMQLLSSLIIIHLI